MPQSQDAQPYKAATRLYVAEDLAASGTVSLTPDQAHYLQHVLRRQPGDEILVFNGRDGEWTAVIANLRKGRGELTIGRQLRPQTQGPDLWLLFAPVKRTRLDFLVQKAVELGAAAIQPVFTRFTMVERVKETRMSANAIEAAEQCGRLDVPDLCDPQDLPQLLTAWDPARRLIFCDEGGCDEGGMAQPLLAALRDQPRPPGPWAVLIGPEGGFHPEERRMLRALPFVLPVTLGPRILRSDTAAIVALSLWQSVLEDWPGDQTA